MYSLFKIRKILSVSQPGGGKDVNIIHSAYSETKEHSILALVCDNGYLLFRYISVNFSKPVVRQLCWFNNSEKQIKSLTFDSAGLWLLLVTHDATIYILPLLPILETDVKVSSCWKLDNLTEIKLGGRRAPLTSVQWWETHEGQHIAIIGSELGEISFINLINKKEVGGTYITTGIAALDILYDESHDTTYLLITGNNQQQWRLLLEEKKSNIHWPLTSESEVRKSAPVIEKTPLSDEKNTEQRPHRLSKFESGTYLTPQCGCGRNLVSAYNPSSCLLQVLEGDLDQMHLFSYKVPPDCESIILSEKLIFATVKSTSDDQHILKIISRKFSEISSETSKKKEFLNAEIQKFTFDGEISALYKLVIHRENLNGGVKNHIPTSTRISNSTASENVTNSTQNKRSSAFSGCENVIQNLESTINEEQELEGCILVQKTCVWECKLRISPKELFLSLTALPCDLPFAEKLGVMLGLDLPKLYEVAADKQLSQGQFAQAVHLYQLSKCPQLKRVAHFMGYGFLSELIAYIQVLFSTKGVEIVSADKCHFANIALHCFTHQVKDKLQERLAISTAFKRFLKENAYYDEEVAAKLLAEQGLYELMHYFAKVRGQQGLMVETLLSNDIKNALDSATTNAIHIAGYEEIFQHGNDDFYLKCITSYHLLQFLAAKPQVLYLHIQHLITLLPQMDPSLLRRIAFLYDPSRQTAKLSFRNMASNKTIERYWSLTSLTTVASEVLDIDSRVENTAGEDVIKFFLFVLLMLCHKLDCPKFDKKLIEIGGVYNSRKKAASRQKIVKSSSEFLSLNHSSISCGQAHAAYVHNGILYTWGKTGSGRLGTEDVGAEYQVPQPVPAFLRLQVTVLTVSCGALHTLALTDYGLFSWGSSRFGQLGVGEVQQAIQPLIIESLQSETIIKIECGQYHSLALTTEGRVFSWGWGIHGQLGHGNAENLYLPKIIKALKKVVIVSISAGQGHSVLLSQNEEVYTFGCGMFGQLGTGYVSKHSYPQLVNIPEHIKLIASGHFHVLAVSRTNRIYTWGCNPQALRLQAQNSRRARHQGNILYQNSRSSNYVASTIMSNSTLHRSGDVNETLQQSHLLPSLVNSASVTDTIIQLSCGSHHSVLITTCGDMYSWGRNSEGQIGNGTRREQKIPTLISNLKEKKIVQSACGADFTIAVDSDGRIWGWGQNDSGQIGQKPVMDTNAKPTSTTSGRVITIRTNRRMITITQPCRQSILRPAEIVIPSYELKVKDLDSGSFENEYSVLKLINHKGSASSLIKDIPDLSKLDKPPYGPFALHTALKVFHRFCDSCTLLNHCLKFGNFQAAATLCVLESLYDKALEYQLKALISFSDSNKTCLDMALCVIGCYVRLLDHTNIATNQKFLKHVINFWIENELPISPLESFFKRHLQLFSYPLSLLLFSDRLLGLDSEIRNEFFNLLSSRFCLNIMYGVLKDIQSGSHFIDLSNEMVILSDTSRVLSQIHAFDTLTAWDDCVPVERLWLDILRNLQSGVISHSSIPLTASDVDILAKTLLTEEFYLKSVNNIHTSLSKLTVSGIDTVMFSCGHHQTLPAFQANIQSLFKDSMNMLSYSLPLTSKLLLSEYHASVFSAACPKCVVTEINNIL